MAFQLLTFALIINDAVSQRHFLFQIIETLGVYQSQHAYLQKNFEDMIHIVEISQFCEVDCKSLSYPIRFRMRANDRLNCSSRDGFRRRLIRENIEEIVNSVVYTGHAVMHLLSQQYS